MLGNVKFIGELGRLDLLSEAILHRCIKTLLEKQRDEKYADMSEDLECLCKMMPTVGRKLDQGEAVKLMDQYFERMKKLGSLKLPAVPGQKEAMPALPQRIRFLLQDLIDLRVSEWQPRQTQIDQAPKTMNEVRNGAIMEEMAAAAAVASSKEAQDAAAALSFNMSASFLPPNSVMFSSMPGRSALMMNMYHQLSQQPNMSLLNAINGKIASNKKEQLAASQNKTAAATLDIKPAAAAELKQTHEASSPTGGRLTGDNNESALSKPAVQSSSQTECGESNESLLLKRSNPISKQVVTHNFVSNQSEPQHQQHHQFIYSSHKNNPTQTSQRGNPRKNNPIGYNMGNGQPTTISSSHQTLNEQQKININNYNNNNNNNNSMNQKNLKMTAVDSDKTATPTNLIKKATFNWNNNNNNNNNTGSGNNPIQPMLTSNTDLTGTHSISSSSSPFSSTSSLSASPPLPIAPSPTLSSSSTNASLAEQLSTKLCSTSLSGTASSSSTSSKIKTEQAQNVPLFNEFNRTQNPNNFNNNNNNNNYNFNNNNMRRTNYANQRMPYNAGSHLNNLNTNNVARNALGVSTNEVLPLNKPIIPLEKVIKHEHPNKHQIKLKAQPSAQQAQPTLSSAPTSAVGHTTVVKPTAQVAALSALDETLRKKILAKIDTYLNKIANIESEDMPAALIDILADFKELKLSNEKMSDAIRLIITHSLSKADSERMQLSKLFVALHGLELSADVFMNALKVILQNLFVLESEYHCVKSSVSMYAARAVTDQLISFDELSSLMRHGAHYPLFFLCMQNMHKLNTKEWLRAQLEKSKISLIEMLPSGDRHKDRLIQILEDRELSFVYPMLKIESTLLEKIQSNSLSSDELKEWIEANVSPNVTNSTDFIHSLVTCIVKNASENSVLSNENNSFDLNSKMDKEHVNKQKQLIQQYQKILQDYLSSKQAKQVEAIYAMQVYANSKGFPKYYLAHLFNQMYDLEIIEEEAFLQWKDEINENYPNKGQALFYLQRWFNWLQEAPEESSGSEDESTTSTASTIAAKKIEQVEV